MRHLAAYLLLALGGNTNITSADIQRVLTAAGASADEAKIELLLQELAGKDINTLITEGRAKMGTMVCAASSAPAHIEEAAPVEAEAPAKGKGKGKGKDKEPEPEKPVEDEKPAEEEGVDLGGFGLFD
ncbi:large subunit ribosomal protein LP2 [Pelomyxa schiedti]|nr:large subunit ribosomal protein LP2 [Pelomyxa schiedti]